EMNNHRHNIKLFLILPDHQPPSLKLITHSSDLIPTCFIEVIIWRSDQETFIPPRHHVLVVHTYYQFTYCSACNRLMWGIYRQGKQCKVCKRDFHHRCAEHLPADCPGTDTRRGSSLRHQLSYTTVSSMSQNQIYTDPNISSISHTPRKRTKFQKLFNVSISEHSSSNSKSSVISSTPNSLTNNSRRNTYFQQNQSANVNTRSPIVARRNFNPNQRRNIKLTNCHEKDGVWIATGQFGRETRHSKRAEISYDKKKFRFTQKDDQENTNVFEIPAADIEGHRSQLSSAAAINTFRSVENVSGSPPTQAVVYQNLACLLLDTINEAVQSTKDHKACSSFKIVRGTENDTKDFADLYDMNEKEILGMGRFSMVFGGTMRRNGVRVAIKKIQTTRCTQKDRENIEQEAAYLFQLNHPGVLKFEGIFDFEQHILLVTEQLDTDMLNFILSNTNPKSRLKEDVTRFLAFQLVAAIRYLHFKNIAHCDLKPENVLINIFPDDVVHLKVGDFGDARTIHEHSLRYTKVGTTAYLPPEVSLDQWQCAKGYNKTVDMWAIGVIIFLSITGYFPFYDDMDILPQLENIPLLFQDELFSHVTEEVKDLLRCRLLVPDAGHRMHSAGVIYHDWFQKSENLLALCRQLEQYLEKKWLTLFFEEADSNPIIPFETVEGFGNSY
ncbi:unnamed protein product, partial [Rotaria sordida]